MHPKIVRLFLPIRKSCGEYQPPPLLTFIISALERLIERVFEPYELPSLIEAVFSSKDERDAIDGLLRDDAQNFVDVINDARHTFSCAI